MRAAAVDITGVGCRYGAATIFQDISFSVPCGDYVGIVGPNGSGKSSLIRIMLGLTDASTGTARLFGTEVRHFEEWGRIGYLPQNLRFMNPQLPASVEEVVRLGLLGSKRFPKIYTADDRRRVQRALEALGIDSLCKRRIGELSGGQQQRVLLAKAIASEPDLLVMDEPTTALDPETRERFFVILNDLRERRGTTVILITHDTGSIGKHAQKLLYLDKRIVFYGSFQDFCTSPEMTGVFGAVSQHLICQRHGGACESV